jgi:hypothetical protein
MNDLEEMQLLSKKNYQNEQIFKLINGNEVLITGSLTKVANFIGQNEIFNIININDNKHLANDWRYATEKEVSSCLYQARLNFGFIELND